MRCSPDVVGGSSLQCTRVMHVSTFVATWKRKAMKSQGARDLRSNATQAKELVLASQSKLVSYFVLQVVN